MAHYYGEIIGKAKTTAHRLGTKNSGLVGTVASWSGGCRIDLDWDQKNQCDILTVRLIPWSGAGTSKILYRGRVDQDQQL